MSTFLEPSSYHHLCDECRVALAQITRLFESGDMGDTDDQEAPCNFMYDNKLFCAGSSCGPSIEDEQEKLADSVAGDSFTVTPWDK